MTELPYYASPPEIDAATRLISGSEVSTWQLCQMKWLFQFKLGRQPKKLSDALFIGTMGHEALSTYYTLLKDGVDWSNAVESMTDFVVREMAKNNEQRKSGFITGTMASERQLLIMKLAGILEDYAKVMAEQDSINYEVVEVEAMHVSKGFFAMRLDLLLRERSTQDLILMDHKFLRNFYQQKQLSMNSQIVRYIKVVGGDREEKVKKGMLNMLRTHESAVERFERAVIPYDETVANRRIADQLHVAEQVRVAWAMSNRECIDTLIRTLSDYTCKFCAFAEVCMLALAGRESDMKAELQMNFEKSTYGYNK